MHDAHAVAVANRVDDGPNALARISLRKLVSFQDGVEQLAALHEFHNEAPMPFILVDVIQTNDVRVVNLL